VNPDFARRLERERDEWKAKYIQQNKDLGCEMMDPAGTIWDYASGLQRENAQLKREIENLKAAGIHTCHDQCQRPMCVMRRQRDEAIQQRDRLEEALRSIANGSHCMQCYGGDGVWIAQQAIAAVKGGQP
jgi:phenylacetate-coenzyme A ligase PaaK-like adenylate-forming protein